MNKQEIFNSSMNPQCSGKQYYRRHEYSNHASVTVISHISVCISKGNFFIKVCIVIFKECSVSDIV